MGELLRRRRLMVSASQTPTPTPALPDEYQQTEYTERPSGAGGANGYCTSPLTLTDGEDTEFKIGLMVTHNYSANAYFIGNLSSKTSNSTGVGIHTNSGSTQISIFSGTYVAIEPNNGSSIVNQYYDITATLTSTGASITDGTHSNSASFTPRAINVTPLYVLALKKYNVPQATNGVYGRIYYAQVRQNDVLKLNLIPCYRKSDNAAGFYDTVAGAFIYDSHFVSGPEV